MSYYTRTPLVREFANKLPQFLVKHEVVQPGGSFKSRGIGHLIAKESQRISRESPGKKIMVVSSSGGNAGVAAATASRSLNLPCTVTVPKTTKQIMIDKIRSRGATVVVHGNQWSEADAYLKNHMLQEFGSGTYPIETIYVHPFDHPIIWEGHSSMIDEIVEDLKDVSVDRIKGIVCSVGGGGLYNGVMTGLERRGLATKIPVIGVETWGCESFHEALKARKLVTLPAITSVATSLGASQVSSKTLEFALKYNSKSVVLNDVDVLTTCLKYNEEYGKLLEPACAASLSLGYHPELLEQVLDSTLSKDDIVIIIACGGPTTSLEVINNELKRLSS